MEFELGHTPGFFSAAIGGSDNVFDQSFAMDAQAPESNGVDISWRYPDMDQSTSPLLLKAATHYPSPPPATIAFPHQKLCNDTYSSDPPCLTTTDPGNKPPQHCLGDLGKLNTDLDLGSVRFEHGQFTPPSKRVSPIVAERDSSVFSHAPIAHSPQSFGEQERSVDEEPQDVTQPHKKRTRRSRKRNPPSAETEKAKREKLLERNRVAASKCRQKRKSYTNTLEEQARELQHRKDSLSILANSLKDEVLFLKGQMLQHVDCGCTRVRDYLNNEADLLASARHPHLILHTSKTRNSSVVSPSLSASASLADHGSPLFRKSTMSPLPKEQSLDALHVLVEENLRSNKDEDLDVGGLS
jgi:hypothetical protein